jgi:hypothetical protein
MLYTEEASGRAIIEAVAAIAKHREVSRAQVALAWLRRNPVVFAPLAVDGYASGSVAMRLRRRSTAATRGGRSLVTVACTMLWAVSKYRCARWFRIVAPWDGGFFGKQVRIDCCDSFTGGVIRNRGGCREDVGQPLVVMSTHSTIASAKTLA